MVFGDKGMNQLQGQVTIPRDVWEKLNSERSFFHDIIRVLLLRSECEASVPFEDIRPLKRHVLSVSHQPGVDRYDLTLTAPEPGT